MLTVAFKILRMWHVCICKFTYGSITKDRCMNYRSYDILTKLVPRGLVTRTELFQLRLLYSHGELRYKQKQFILQQATRRLLSSLDALITVSRAAFLWSHEYKSRWSLWNYDQVFVVYIEYRHLPLAEE